MENSIINAFKINYQQDFSYMNEEEKDKYISKLKEYSRIYSSEIFKKIMLVLISDEVSLPKQEKLKCIFSNFN